MKKLHLIFLLCITLISCNKDDMGDSADQEITDQEFLANFGDQVQRDFTGTLLSDNGEPVVGALVTINNKSSTSNAEGVFTINSATVREQLAYIKVESSTHFNASQTIVPTGGINTVRIRMITKSFDYQVNSGQEETVGNSFGTVTLPGNYITESGDIYEGQVDVALFYLDQGSDIFREYTPGMPLVKTENDEPKYATNYGTLLVELKGANGQQLNIAEDNTAILSCKISGPPAISAPTTIKMGYFDEDLGYWIEEGQATKDNGFYVGEVSHFTFWQNLLPENAIFLTINLNDENDMPLSYQNISLISENNGTRGYFTDNLGQVAGYVPINDQLEARVPFYYTFCDDITDIQTIGSFNEDTEITISVEDQGFNSEESERIITGVLLNCNNEPIINGILKLRHGFRTFTTLISDGTFNITINQCDNNSEFEVTSYDITTETSSEAEIYNITGDITDIGTIITCSEIDEYIKFVIDDNVEDTFFDIYTIAGGWLNEFNDKTSIYFYANSPFTNHSYRFLMSGRLNPAPYVGSYTYRDINNPDAKGFTITPYRFGYFNGTPPLLPYENNNIVFNLIELGEVGELVDIEFYGNYEEEDGSPHSIVGRAKFIRRAE